MNIQVSQKCQYAIRSVFELARRFGRGPVKISEISKEQAIPKRFLEVILSELKQAGFLASQRGKEGGYVLLRPPKDLNVGEVINFIEGAPSPVSCVMAESSGGKRCPLYGGCAFLGLWDKVQEAVSSIYNTTTFQDLLDKEALKRGAEGYGYDI